MNIEEAKERCKELTKEAQASWIGLSNIKAISTVLSELEKKDKVINEMAKHIQENEFYDDIICMEKNCKNEECHGECGEDCIKEYFTNKVEREGK